MRKLFTFSALFFVVAFVGVQRLPAQNTQTNQQPAHVLTDEDIQQRYHSNDTTNTTDNSTTSQTDQTTQTNQTDKSTDKTDEATDLDSLKKRLATKQKELDSLKSEHESMVTMGKAIQDNLDKADAEGKDQFQNSLDDNNAGIKKNEDKQKKLEQEISDLKDQVKNAEENDTGTTTTSNENSSNNNQTENTNPPNNQNPQR